MSIKEEESLTENKQSHNIIPLWLKLSFTAFMAILVPFYWKEYGPTNFVYFCDVALFLTLASLWTEKPIYASMAAVGITIPQLLWQVDFLSMLFGIPGTGMTKYMFDSSQDIFPRFLSFFHFWLPILLVYLVYKLGYHRKAFWYWTVLAWGLMLICFFLLPEAGAKLDFAQQPHNVNYVFGMNDKTPQTWMPTYAWLAVLFAGLPIVFYLPTHFILNRLWGNKTIQPKCLS